MIIHSEQTTSKLQTGKSESSTLAEDNIATYQTRHAIMEYDKKHYKGAHYCHQSVRVIGAVQVETLYSPSLYGSWTEDKPATLGPAHMAASRR